MFIRLRQGNHRPVCDGLGHGLWSPTPMHARPCNLHELAWPSLPNPAAARSASTTITTHSTNTSPDSNTLHHHHRRSAAAATVDSVAAVVATYATSATTRSAAASDVPWRRARPQRTKPSTTTFVTRVVFSGV